MREQNCFLFCSGCGALGHLCTPFGWKAPQLPTIPLEVRQDTRFQSLLLKKCHHHQQRCLAPACQRHWPATCGCSGGPAFGQKSCGASRGPPAPGTDRQSAGAIPIMSNGWVRASGCDVVHPQIDPVLSHFFCQRSKHKYQPMGQGCPEV